MNENARLTPAWLVYADGRRLDTEHEGALRRIMVNDRLNGVSAFSLVFDSTVPLRERSRLAFGSRVCIHLGYKDDIEEVFNGEVLGFRTVLPEGGAARLELTGAGALYKLGAAELARSFEEKTPAEIIRAVLKEYSLQAEVEDFGESAPFSAMREETDLSLLLRLAGAAGREVYADGPKVYAAREITVRGDEIIYEWGKNLACFEAAENIRELVPAYAYTGWDIQKNAAFLGEAAPSDIPLRVGGGRHWTEFVPVGVPRALRADFRLSGLRAAKEAAAAALQKNSFRFVRACGGGEGNYRLRPGMRVTIKAAGETVNGEYIADTVRHRFDYVYGYRTDFTLKRNMSP